ncbi:MAG: peptidylprolyl isomerase [Burkholderiales bacterium]|nr:MAG: peptidylprolyl isomerase [Burkholderiales bacterium]
MILNRRSLAAVLLAATTGLAAAQNAAIVNNRPIPSSRVDDFVAALVAQGREDTPQLRAAVREELITRMLFAQEAERLGLAQRKDVATQLETTRQEVLIRALIRDHLANNPITDAQLQSEYEQMTKAAAEREYRASHILVEDEAEARRIIGELKGGAKFEELAKVSKDPGSAQNGGDLDWNTAGAYVRPFAEAMTKLEKGQFTEEPVNTQFGWHVIRLDDVRDAAAPPLDEVKPQLTQMLERQRIQALQQTLRGKARIE